jgi:hypothetical protein
VEGLRRSPLPTIRDEAAGFFVLDMAVDAARMRLSEMQTVQHAAAAGVLDLAAGLTAVDDPLDVRAKLEARVQAWTALVQQVAAQQRQQFKARSQQQMKLQQGQREKVATASATPVPGPHEMPTGAPPVDTAAEAGFWPWEKAPHKAETRGVPTTAHKVTKEKEQEVVDLEGLLGGLFRGWFSP